MGGLGDGEEFFVRACARARMALICSLQTAAAQAAGREGWKRIGDQLGVDSTEQNEGAERLRSHHTPTYARANRRKTQRR